MPSALGDAVGYFALEMVSLVYGSTWLVSVFKEGGFGKLLDWGRSSNPIFYDVVLTIILNRHAFLNV